MRVREGSNVTRFGELCPLWQNFVPTTPIFFAIGQSFIVPKWPKLNALSSHHQVTLQVLDQRTKEKKERET